MKINLEYEKYRKDIIDIYRIFKQDDIKFSADGEIVVGKDFIKLDEYFKFENKLHLKKLLYKYLSNKFKQESPWGLITGTKPQKLLSIHDRKYLKDNFFIDDNKLDLMTDIKKIHDGYNFDKESINLYINIPFCPSRCSYCSFPTIIYTKKDRRNEYLIALIKEIEAISPYLKNRRIRSVYIGGGTPTSFTIEQLKLLLITLKENFNFNNIDEFTIEAGREDTLDYEKLEVMKTYGVNRISINPQTFNKTTADLIERKQDLERMISLYRMAYDLGFIINMDLILGLRGETIKDVEASLAHVGELKPQNLTIHTLSLKKGSKLVDSGLKVDNERSVVSGMVEKSIELAKSLKYKPYYLYRQKEILGNFENIGYTLDSFECIYNIIINEEVESVLGLGMTANSKIFVNGNLKKFTNYKNLDQYIDSLEYQVNEKIKLLTEGEYGR